MILKGPFKYFDYDRLIWGCPFSFTGHAPVEPDQRSQADETLHNAFLSCPPSRKLRAKLGDMEAMDPTRAMATVKKLESNSAVFKWLKFRLL